MYLSIRTADEQEREVLYEQITDIKAERDRQVTKWLTNENVLILVLRHYEKNSAADWRIYAAFINHPIFSELLWELYDGTAKEVTEDENGEYSLYGRNFAKSTKNENEVIFGLNDCATVVRTRSRIKRRIHCF